MAEPVDQLRVGLPKNFLRYALVLLLKESEAHGYDLIEGCRALGIDRVDSAAVYRTLRVLEQEDLVRSSWTTSNRGPARRVYEITPDGEDWLHVWATLLRDTRRTLNRFFDRYESLFEAEPAAREG